MPNYARRRDALQSHRDSIARAFGIQVHDTSQMAAYEPGFPDAIYCKDGRSVFVEYKGSAKEPLTEAEKRWHRDFQGQAVIVRSDEDALRLARELRGIPAGGNDGE